MVVPTPFIVTIPLFLFTVATAGLLDLYVIFPSVSVSRLRKKFFSDMSNVTSDSSNNRYGFGLCFRVILPVPAGIFVYAFPEASYIVFGNLIETSVFLGVIRVSRESKSVNIASAFTPFVMVKPLKSIFTI